MIDPELFPDEANQAQRLRLFCFPHAGGGTSQFYRWRRYAPDSVTIIPARLPGRESRLQQPPVTSLNALAGMVAETIGSLPPGPFALLGYSLGAYLAYEVACRLPRTGDRSPRALVVVASNAPGTKELEPGISELPDQQLIDHIQQKHGGIPAALRHSAQWLAAVVPALRADLRMLHSHRLTPAEPLACPLLAIGGSEDVHVSAAGLAGWRLLSTGESATRQFPGGHFFLYPDFNLPATAGSGRSSASVPDPLATVFQFIQRND